MSAGDAEVVNGDLVIRRLVVGALATNAYVLFDRLTHHAIVVDPGDEPDRLLDATSDLPHDTVVLPGHGRSTTIGAERSHLDDWIARSW